MSNIDQCRDLNKLNPLTECLLELALASIKKQGINPLVVETYRTKERQYYLYGQGRSVSECISAGVPSAKAKQYARSGNKITWTLNSIHIQKKAVDIVPQRVVNGKMTAIWDAKDKETKKIVAIMEYYGFESGANWKSFPDSPHFQMKGEFGKYFTAAKNTKWVTKAIQTGLNLKVGAGLKVDGNWGAKTTKALNYYREMQGWKQNGMIGASGLKKLLRK